MISYSQNFEDVILERYFKDKSDGFYIDIGAAYPELCSVTQHFYNKGWHGINVEPSPILYSLLQQKRTRDINLNIVVSEKNGLVDFFHLPNTGLSTVNEDFAVSVIDQNLTDINSNKIEGIDKFLIESSRLENIFEKFARDIEVDFLKIDVEGAEESVIKSNNWNLFCPKVLVIEATLPNSQIVSYQSWEKVLLQANYSFVYFDGLNRFYLRNDLAGDKKFFSYPPCVFDDFVIYSENEVRLSNEILNINSQLIELQRKYEAVCSQQQGIPLQNATYNHFKDEIQGLNKQIKALKESYSWRITRPLRWFFDVLNRKNIPTTFTDIRVQKSMKRKSELNDLNLAPRIFEIYKELKAGVESTRKKIK